MKLTKPDVDCKSVINKTKQKQTMNEKLSSVFGMLLIPVLIQHVVVIITT